MKICIRPIEDPQREIDVTSRLVSAIAEELWALYGGNDQLNWVEAEWHLQRIIAQTQVEARETEPVLVAASAPVEEIKRAAQPVRQERTAVERSRPSQPGSRRPRERQTVAGAGSRKDSPKREVRQLVNA